MRGRGTQRRAEGWGRVVLLKIYIVSGCGCEDAVSGCYVADETGSAAGDRYMRWEIKPEVKQALPAGLMCAPTVTPQVPAVRN